MKKETKKSSQNAKSIFLRISPASVPPEKLGFHTILAKPTAPLPTYAIILIFFINKVYLVIDLATSKASVLTCFNSFSPFDNLKPYNRKKTYTKTN